MTDKDELNAPWIVKPFPDNLDYRVDVTLCETSLEAYNERMAAYVAQKYNLVYRQGDGITTKNIEQVKDLETSHDELSKYMRVSKIDYQQEPVSMYYFVFDSWE